MVPEYKAYRFIIKKNYLKSLTAFSYFSVKQHFSICLYQSVCVYNDAVGDSRCRCSNVELQILETEQI